MSNSKARKLKSQTSQALVIKEPVDSREPQLGSAVEANGLPPIKWSLATALDPKHRPQVPERPASTVRREWARYPQEAHLLDHNRARIRRLSADEIAILQGFDPSWFNVPGVSDVDRIRAAGNAVPPPLAAAVCSALTEARSWHNRTHVELCAGVGGLASGLAGKNNFETLALLDFWPVAGRILRHNKPWAPDVVHVGDIRDFPLRRFRGRTGILSGGLPCQPWSQGGAQLGHLDARDLMGSSDLLIAELQPEAFVWENVPGLTSEKFRDYFDDLLARLRRPSNGLRYGVMAGILNAADFGVPQARRRLIIIGLRDASTRDVARVFDSIDRKVTHRGLRSWITVGEALGAQIDRGRWMHWPYGRARPIKVSLMPPGNETDEHEES